MLRVHDLFLRLGKFSLSADFSIARGEFCLVTGPSGAGKSSLFLMLAGFFRPEKGQIFLDSQNMTVATPDKRPVRLVFQENNLFPKVSVGQNIAVGAKNPDRKQLQEGIEWALCEVRLGGFASRMPETLSGGEKQRVALARCLLGAKPILIMDEPVSALGPAARIEMLNLIADLAHRHKLAVLLSTHYPDEVWPLASSVLFVDQGHAGPTFSSTICQTDFSAALKKYLGSGR